MRNSMGLLSVQVYQDQDEEESYFALSIWKDKESFKSYLASPQIKDGVLKSPDIEWYKELEYDIGKSIESVQQLEIDEHK